jgi:hypothetical protein
VVANSEHGVWRGPARHQFPLHPFYWLDVTGGHLSFAEKVSSSLHFPGNTAPKKKTIKSVKCLQC